MGDAALRQPWICGTRTLDVGARTLLMGIVNCTPDSFSDGGRFDGPADAVRHGLRLIDEGADLLDVGGESTRPGAVPVDPEEELRRVVPVIEGLRARTGVPLSIDTRKAAVARRALEAGADLVNDVSAGRADPGMPEVVRGAGAGVVLMHMQGEPGTMQQAPVYADVVGEVAAFLRERMTRFIEAGVPAGCIALDPGIGFGKTLEHNLELLAGLPALAALGRPVLVGVSRKRFLEALTGRVVDDRVYGSIGAGLYAVSRGAHILRVHDVKQTCDAIRVVDTLRTRQRG